MVALPVRYPYLVTSPSWSTTETTVNGQSDPLANFLEDVDMDGPEPTNEVLSYVVLDTNILMNHLHLVRQVYTVLNRASPTTHALLIPSMVINELDKLKLSIVPAGVTPDGPVTSGDLAKAATRWLLDINWTKKEVGHGAIRLQKWSEHLNKNLDKGDDKILDCCLFFSTSTRVLLWTNDQNLLLLAESNEVRTLRGYSSIRLEHILRALDITISSQDLTTLRQSHSSTSILHVEHEEDGMELDDEYISTPGPLPSLSTTERFSSPPTRTSSARWTFGSTGTSPTSDTPLTSTTTSRRPSATLSTPRPTTLLPAPLLSRLSAVLTAALTTIRPGTTFDIDLSRQLTTLIDLLLEFEKTTIRPSDINMNVLRSISALRTISAFVQVDNNGKRRPRIGEVADALDLLAATFRHLGVLDNEDDLRLLAVDIRELP